ncbi:MAG TPA: hypothetical protein VJ795_15060 [Rheinheimera sp.]|uniref:hypothetical protein n=1 Tax=Rheinheimera sp. TaxID=1869214 RepID=UPI002B48FAE3|nr:hypothetical protein [Rheinheimera sp.]HJS16393.1 hypothetical protein [Rheinheimera sp.]
MNKFSTFVLILLLCGCMSNRGAPIKESDLPKKNDSREIVVYIISPKGYFPPYEFYLIDINGVKKRIYFGTYSYISFEKYLLKKLDVQYQFNSHAKVGYSDEVNAIHEMSLFLLTTSPDPLFLLRSGGEFKWVDKSEALQAMSDLVLADFTQ